MIDSNASMTRLRLAMARQVPASARELAAELQVSVPTVHRLLQSVPMDQLVAAGQARRARYALRRVLRGTASSWPVYRVDFNGRADAVGTLALLQSQGTWMDVAPAGWPVPDESRDGWWPGLPYPLQDMRPQGYLGRLLARAEHAQLMVPAEVEAWTEDDVLYVLTQRASDTSGNLIVGDRAYARWQADRLAGVVPLQADEVASAYEALAQQAISSGVPGSSAAGEFPKFTACRQALPGQASHTPHVLVKFSGADGSAAVQRWSDLLVCEHLALQVMAERLGLPVAASRVVHAAGRTFLEVERFDRHGDWGRSALCSLATVDAAFIGSAVRDWPHLAARLAALGLLREEDVLQVERWWWFGRLIANSDMHTGNLSLGPGASGFALAPAYDMLPMLHAPLAGGEVPVRSFDPPLPSPLQRAVWQLACEAALQFWRLAAADARISEPFRTLCAQHAHTLEDKAQHA